MARRIGRWIDRLMAAIQGPDDQGAFPPGIGPVTSGGDA